MLRRLKRAFVVVLIGLIVVIGGIILLAVNRLRETEAPDPRYVDSRALWDSKAVSDYRIGMDMFGASIIPIGIDMIVQDGAILVSSFIACDTPNARHPAANCDVIRRYYPDMQGYTVEQLFETASTCMTETRRILPMCNFNAAVNFTSFSNPEDMMNTTQNCSPDLGSFCAVEYDPVWGYPSTIWEYTPQVTDGFSMVSVTRFEAAAP